MVTGLIARKAQTM